MTEAILRITPATTEEADLWRLAEEVAAMFEGLPWVLIGGVMVRILEAEHGVQPAFATGDLDVVLDLRALTTATRIAAERLQKAGFEPERHDDSVTYRFTRGGDTVDLLAPDNMGNRASRVTVPPDQTIEAAGGSQAIHRRRVVTVDPGTGRFSLPVPSLAGALVAKARAATKVVDDRSRAKHERDLARLLVLVPDPTVVRNELRRRELGYLRALGAMKDSGHRAWARVSRAEDGVAALDLIIG